MAERARRRSRSRSPLRRNSDRDMGIQDRLKKISGIDVDHSIENGDKETKVKVDREKVQ